MLPPFKLKFIDPAGNSFTLRFVPVNDKQTAKDAYGSWFLVKGKIKLSQGNWQLSNEGYVLCYDKDHILNSEYAKLNAADVVTPDEAFKTGGKARLLNEWAIIPEAGGTRSGPLRWEITG